MRLRRCVSLTVFLAFIVMAVTGLVLWITPQGRVAHWAEWRLAGLDKDQWGALHSTFMILFLVTGIWHTVLNWTALVSYFSDSAKRVRVFTREFNVALLLCAVFVVGTLQAWPPLAWVTGVSDWSKASWEETLGSPPYGHAELDTLERFVNRLGRWGRGQKSGLAPMSVEDAVRHLQAAGFDAAAPGATLTDIARDAGRSPQDVMTTLEAAAPTSSAAPHSSGRQRGRHRS